ncbi:hypothetical protein GCM10020358_19460 [Amorphoplanes nipponensis]|uniref:hypothetical protein n=1 Tax=Actinoplanes nipponensis TaxID=135950 RepID=UPI0031F06027
MAEQGQHAGVVAAAAALVAGDDPGAGAVLCATWAVRAYAPRWLTVFGGVAGLAVALPAAELAGADIGPLVVVGTTVVQFWFMATAAVIILRARRGNTQKLS